MASIVQLLVGPSKLPLAALALALPIAVRIVSSDRPRAASAATFAWMRTAGRCPPDMETRPTPETCAILFENCRSTIPCTSPSGRVSDVTPSEMIGASAGLTLA